jgi:hydrogenase expression/formation protein HypC
LMLVGPLPVGTALLVHTGNAIRALSDEELPLLERALDGLDAALAGENVTPYFADLVGREPQLPAHLRPGLKAEEQES